VRYKILTIVLLVLPIVSCDKGHPESEALNQINIAQTYQYTQEHKNSYVMARRTLQIDVPQTANATQHARSQTKEILKEIEEIEEILDAQDDVL